VTADGDVVVISPDGTIWDLPAGRPEPGESWEQTLRREMDEEACATVVGARLPGFTRGQCLTGPERGTGLVRSMWRAEVELRPWEALFEIADRRVVPPDAVEEALSLGSHPHPTNGSIRVQRNPSRTIIFPNWFSDEGW
jgi:ADP-ribose pyrophosphatase YjhB (NUDIX family)